MGRTAFLPKFWKKAPNSFQVIDDMTDKPLGFVSVVLEASD